MKSYKERLEIAKSITKNNRMFLAVAAILLIVVVTNMVQQRGSQKPEVVTEVVQETVSSETVPEETATEEPPKWRFYPVDLVILAVGGGFCGIMIILEKKKARENLQ